MEVHYMDPALAHLRGHVFAHALAIAEECERRDIPLHIFGNQDAAGEVVDRLHCSRQFYTARWSGKSWKLARRVVWSAVLMYVARSRQFFRELDNALSGRVGSKDVVVFGSTDCSLLAGYAHWLASVPPHARPHLAIILRVAAGHGLDRRRLPSLSRILYRKLLRRIQRLAPGKVLIGTDTILVAQDFEQLLGSPLSFIPLPLNLPEASQRPAGTRQVELVFLGDARPEKGFGLLPEALSKALDKNPGLSATIQVTKPYKSQLGLIDRLRQLAPRVQLVEKVPEMAEFYGRIGDSDAVLLPYEPAAYAKRSSGILAEAASLARPVIVTSGTFLEKEMKRVGIAGTICERYDSSALAEAISRFVKNRDELQREAWRLCASLRKLHTAEQFVDQLVNLTKTGSSCAAPAVRTR